MINDPEATGHFVEDFSHAFSGFIFRSFLGIRPPRNCPSFFNAHINIGHSILYYSFRYDPSSFNDSAFSFQFSLSIFRIDSPSTRRQFLILMSRRYSYKAPVHPFSRLYSSTLLRIGSTSPPSKFSTFTGSLNA